MKHTLYHLSYRVRSLQIIAYDTSHVYRYHISHPPPKKPLKKQKKKMFGVHDNTEQQFNLMIIHVLMMRANTLSNLQRLDIFK